MNKRLRETDSPGILCKELSKELFGVITKNMLEFGMDPMTISHSWILGYLYDHQDERICQKDLESRFSMAKSSITAAVQIMEKSGYIERKSVEGDARLKQIVLTDDGIKMFRDVEKCAIKAEESARKDIDKEDYETYLKVMQKMFENIEKEMKSEND